MELTHRRSALLLCFLWGCSSPGLEDHVRYLASDELEGRATGEPGERLAGDYIAGKFRKFGIDPVFQEFKGHAGEEGRNVIGVVRGRSEECVVVGAHYDHLGRTKKGDICHGADDNASGTAMVLDLASRFARSPAYRTVVFAAFSGEEGGLFGSRHYTRNPVIPLEQTVAMVNLDMVGRLRGKVTVFGVPTGDRFAEYLADCPIPVVTNADPWGASDHASFYPKGVPSVHFFSGAHSDYHKPGDTADKINYDGMRMLAGFLEKFIRRVADAPERMKYVKVAAPEPVAAAPGARPYFGSMPDYGYDQKGTRLEAVSPGSPAEKAGLRSGDVVVEIDGKEVADVQAYSNLLFAKKPGDEMAISWLRDGKRMVGKAVLAARKPED